MLSQIGMSSDEIIFAEQMLARLRSSKDLIRACALISCWIVRPDTDWPDELNLVTDREVQEVLARLGGRVLNVAALNSVDNLYLSESLRPSLDDGEELAPNVWKVGNIAVKRVLMEDPSVRELAIMCSLKHPRILSATGFYFEDRYVFICIPLQSRTLFDLIYSGATISDISEERPRVWDEGRTSRLLVVPLRDRRRLARELLEGLSYLHSQRVVHGDIKPDNLFLDSRDGLKVADFGSSITNAVSLQMGDSSSKRCCVRHPLKYRDPNVKTLNYSFESDVWGAAVILLELETGILPLRVTKYVNLGAIEDDVQFSDTIRLMLQDPPGRITADQALALLR